MFYDGFEYNSTCFNDSRKLIHVLCVTGKNRSSFLHPTLRPVLHPTLSPVLHPTLRHSSCTKTMGDLAVIISAANDGRIRDMGFFVLVASSY
jgi:hypothetical protein